MCAKPLITALKELGPAQGLFKVAHEIVSFVADVAVPVHDERAVTWGLRQDLKETTQL
jgi:hypothetical protein